MFLINEHKPAILAISETWLVPDSRFRVPGYACLRDDRDDGYAGSAILIKRSLAYTSISLPLHSRQFNAVAVRSLNISILSIYIPHPNSSLISELKSVLSSIPSPVLVLGDFNAHHTFWGSHSCDGFATLLVDLFDELNICVLNDGTSTRRVYPNQNPRTAVDLSLCSPSLASLSSWSILPSTHGSDHYPILLSIAQRSIPVAKANPLLKYKVNRANWPAYADSVDCLVDTLPKMSDDENILLYYDSLVRILKFSADLHVPLKKTGLDFIMSPPWWDNECTVMVNKRRKAENSYSLLMSRENFLEYQRTDAEYKRLLSRKKKHGWTKFCESLDPRSPSSFVWARIKRFRCSVSSSDPTSSDESIWLDAFADTLAPPSVPTKDCFPSSSFLPSTDSLDAPFSYSELHCVLLDLKDSSPGEDGIPYSFLVNLNDKAKHSYLDMVNRFLETGIVPDPWKSQIIIPIRKPRKDPLDCNSYRPIALSSTLAKIMEHLIKNRFGVDNRKQRFACQDSVWLQ
ncbi:jg1323, partial [Pararge aegeria aegeria]